MPSPAAMPNCQDCTSRGKGLLCSLSQSNLKEIDEHKSIRRYKRGEVIFYEGKPVSGMYCLFTGRVKLVKSTPSGRQHIVRIAGPGDLLGYRSLVSEEPYHATAEAMQDCDICCIDTQTFLEMLSRDPLLAKNLLAKLAKELRGAEDHATSLAYRSVRERMAELLLILKASYGEEDTSGTRLDIQLSRAELADMIGVTQETAIRLVSDFKKEGLISVQGRNLTINDPATLVTMANAST